MGLSRNKVAVPEGAAGTPPFWMYMLSGETDAVHYKNEEDVRRSSAFRPSSEENTFFQKTKKDDASVSVTKRMVATATVERLYKQQLWFTGD